MGKNTVNIEFTETEAYLLAGYLREALANNDQLIRGMGSIKHALGYRKDVYSALKKIESNEAVHEMIEQEKRLLSD